MPTVIYSIKRTFPLEHSFDLVYWFILNKIVGQGSI